MGKIATVVTLHCDASNDVWGVEFPGCKLAGKFQERHRPIHQKETIAVSAAISQYLVYKNRETSVGRTQLIICCDNTVVVNSWKKRRSKDIFVTHEIAAWEELSLKFNIDIQLISVNTRQQVADAASRWNFGIEEITLSESGIKRLYDILNVYPHIDAFANQNNVLPIENIKYISKLPLLNRDPNCIAVDLFAQNTRLYNKRQLIWAFPPVHLVEAAVRKFVEEEASALILCKWTRTMPSWLPLVLNSGGYVHMFCKFYEKTILILNGKKMRCNTDFVVVVTKNAKLLKRDQ